MRFCTPPGFACTSAPPKFGESALPDDESFMQYSLNTASFHGAFSGSSISGNTLMPCPCGNDGAPAASSSVAAKSNCSIGVSITVPTGILPGQLTMAGTRTEFS